MTVKLIAKQKTAPKQKASAVEDMEQHAIAGMVEELAVVKKELDKVKKVEKRYDELRAALKELIPADTAPDQEVVFQGVDHYAVFAPQANVRSIADMKKIYKALGADLFFSICKVNLTDVDKYLSQEEQKGLITEARTGNRNLAVKEK